MGNSLFRMNDTVDIDNMLDDFQHRVTGIIERYKDESDFPRLENYHSDRESLDDYLFTKQAILDSEGTERSRYTLAGILIIIPIVVIALFPMDKLPYKEYTVFPAILIGLFLYIVVSAVRKAAIKMRLRNLDGEKPEEKRYVDAVLEYGRK